MTIQHQFLLLIHILYCAAIIHGILLDISDDETCSALCKECNAFAVFVNNQCKCNFNDNDNKDVECIQRLHRDIQTIDLNTLSDDLTKKERSLRFAFKPRRRLRIGDAEKVAQYFMNGGASAGHSHFIRESNAICNNTNSATNSISDIVRQSNTEDEFHLPLPTSPLSGSTYKSYSPLHMVSETKPTMPNPSILGTKPYNPQYPILGIMRPTFDYPTNRLYPPGPILDSVVQPYRKYGYKSPLKVLPLQTSALPSYILHDLAARRYSPYYTLMHHNPIGENSYPRQDNSLTVPFVGQPNGNNNNFNHQDSNNSFTTRNNAGEFVQGNGASIPAARMNALYPSMRYGHLISLYPYTPYHSSLFNSPLGEYIPQAVPHYFQSVPNPTLTFVQNPNSSCTNNTSIERQDKMSITVTNETVYSNDKQIEKTDDTTSISKEQKEM